MAFIKIITIPGGNGASCSKYYFKGGSRQNNKKWIGIHEVVEVPDAELEGHLATGKVMECRGPDDVQEPKARGRPKATGEGFAQVLAAQR